jgi:hypothetical protein
MADRSLCDGLLADPLAADDCNATDPDAARWTGRGAVAAETTDTQAAYRSLDRAADDLNTRAASCTAGLCCQPHDVALKVFDRAITMAEATS